MRARRTLRRLPRDRASVRRAARAETWPRALTLSLAIPGWRTPPRKPVIGADAIVRYRTRAKLIVAPGGKIGLFGKGGGHHVIDIPDCRVLSPSLAEVAAVLRNIVRSDEQTGDLWLPMIRPEEVRYALSIFVKPVPTREKLRMTKVLVTFVVQRTQVTDQNHWRGAARHLVEMAPSVAGVAVNFRGDGDILAGTRQRNDAPPWSLVRAWIVDRGIHITFATFGSFCSGAPWAEAARIHAMLAEVLNVGVSPTFLRVS